VAWTTLRTCREVQVRHGDRLFYVFQALLAASLCHLVYFAADNSAFGTDQAVVCLLCVHILHNMSCYVLHYLICYIYGSWAYWTLKQTGIECHLSASKGACHRYVADLKRPLLVLFARLASSDSSSSSSSSDDLLICSATLAAHCAHSSSS